MASASVSVALPDEAVSKSGLRVSVARPSGAVSKTRFAGVSSPTVRGCVKNPFCGWPHGLGKKNEREPFEAPLSSSALSVFRRLSV